MSFLGAGLRFGCTACGKCCVSKATNVFVNQAEVKAMAAVLKMDVFEFVREYTEDRENVASASSDETLLTSIKNVNGTCALLSREDRRTCTVYSARPVQCQTYPFWTSNVIGEAEWRAEAVRCEGISARAPLVPAADIARQLIVSQIHARGVGENWTHEQSTALLDEAVAASPSMLPDFLDEFAATYRSRILHESPLARVVDTTLPPAAAASDDDGGGDGPASTVRRLEFCDSPHVSQTEMRLDEDGRPDHAHLVFSVHRAMGVAALLAVKSLDAPSARVWVLGAGGGALPAFLRLHAPDCHVDAVEPSAEVLRLAADFFALDFASGDGLAQHAQTGEEFVQAGGAGAGQVPDVVIVDTCVDGAAPAPAMLELPFLRALRARLSPPAASSASASASASSASAVPGIVLVNVLTSGANPGSGEEGADALATLSRHAPLAGFGPPIVLAVHDSPNLVVVLAAAGEASEARAGTLVELLLLAQEAQEMRLSRV